MSNIVYDKGCLKAGEEWLERNLLLVAGIAVGIAFMQVRLDFKHINVLKILFRYFFLTHSQPTGDKIETIKYFSSFESFKFLEIFIENSI